jgi:hypothetical protein
VGVVVLEVVLELGAEFEALDVALSTAWRFFDAAPPLFEERLGSRLGSTAWCDWDVFDEIAIAAFCAATAAAATLIMSSIEGVLSSEDACDMGSATGMPFECNW